MTVAVVIIAVGVVAVAMDRIHIHQTTHPWFPWRCPGPGPGLPGLGLWSAGGQSPSFLSPSFSLGCCCCCCCVASHPTTGPSPCVVALSDVDAGWRCGALLRCCAAPRRGGDAGQGQDRVGSGSGSVMMMMMMLMMLRMMLAIIKWIIVIVIYI